MVHMGVRFSTGESKGVKCVESVKLDEASYFCNEIQSQEVAVIKTIDVGLNSRWFDLRKDL